MLLLSNFDLTMICGTLFGYCAGSSYFVVTKGEDTMQKKLSFFLVFVLLFTCLLTACGPDDTGADLENFSDETFNYISYQDGWGVAAAEGFAQAELTVPAEVKGRPVVRVEQEGFANITAITKVTVPESVKFIGESAFAGCTALATVDLHDGAIVIGDEAFSNTAFYNNASNWEADVLYLGKYLLEAKLSVSGEYTVKDGTVAIAGHAFAERDDDLGYMGCAALTAVNFPASLKTIGDGAFKNCTALTTFSVPDSVTYLGDYAFHNTAYFNDKINDEKNETDVFYIGTHLVQANAAYLDESYTVKEGTTTIASPAFAGCDKLTTVEIPASVTRIGIAAFRNCKALTSIVFDGTEEEWNAISKGYGWNQNLGEYQITFKKTATPEK